MAQASRMVKVDKKGPYIEHLGGRYRFSEEQDYTWVVPAMLRAGQLVTIMERWVRKAKSRITSRLNATKIYWDQEE